MKVRPSSDGTLSLVPLSGEEEEGWRNKDLVTPSLLWLFLELDGVSEGSPESCEVLTMTSLEWVVLQRTC